jgi:hypothetical protein
LKLKFGRFYIFSGTGTVWAHFFGNTSQKGMKRQHQKEFEAVFIATIQDGNDERK